MYLTTRVTGIIFRSLTSEDGPHTGRIKTHLIAIDPYNRYEGIGMKLKDLTETFIKNGKNTPLFQLFKGTTIQYRGRGGGGCSTFLKKDFQTEFSSNK